MSLGKESETGWKAIIKLTAMQAKKLAYRLDKSIKVLTSYYDKAYENAISESTLEARTETAEKEKPT